MNDNFDPVRLEVFKHLLVSIAEEMGVALGRTAYSPNIKERRDYSCALFDAQGNMVAQAAHIPVHLGAMPMSVQACLQELEFAPGDVAILNDPYHGGTHLPDITLVTPIFKPGDAGHLVGFAASRAHHADVGGMTPGSMPPSTELFQEGVIIPPLKLIEDGRLNRALLNLILANVRTPSEREGDLRAQVAANQKGHDRLLELTDKYGQAEVHRAMAALLAYAERMTRNLLEELPDGVYHFEDAMEDDGVSDDPAAIKVAIQIDGDQATIDFTGSSPQRRGSINAVYAITLSATYYCFRCLMDMDIPSNSGCLVPLHVIAPVGSVVNARPPAAVAGGNVETSQRITDVVLGALAQARPDRIPAASQGTMNNITLGGWDPVRQRAFAYYETIGGGMGARPTKDGASAIHVHMTNTLNTPIEALEFAYPFRVRRYGIRDGSGGDGNFRGGDGVIRELEILHEARLTLLTERRRLQPYGLQGGSPGVPGRNTLLRDGETIELPAKASLDVLPGDVISLHTPGGGGFGRTGDEV
jgi:N-methylhydantoinase B